MDRNNHSTLYVALTLLGVVAILASMILGTPSNPQPIWSSLGWALVGSGLIVTVISTWDYLRERGRLRKIEDRFKPRVTVAQTVDLPRLLVADIEGCITPPHRAQVDLLKLSRLRAYCEFVDHHREYPQLVFCTGRSQGYVELLAQSLGMLESGSDLPFIIENGAALYKPRAKKTIALISQEQQDVILGARRLLGGLFENNEFEPKSFMITLNPTQDQIVDDLREAVSTALKEADYWDDLELTSNASSVDISPRNVTKLSGLHKALKEHLGEETGPVAIDQIVAFGDQLSDLLVLKAAGRPYCPARSHAEVRQYVEQTFGPAHVVDKEDIDFVTEVIERECGLSIA